MSVLVGITGGAGFIGKALVLRHLAGGDTVRMLTRRPSYETALPDSVHMFYGDLTGQAESLIPFIDGVDVLYHCAGEIKDQMKMYSVHVTGTENLCTAANGRIGHWVQLSSVGVYGPQYSGTVTEETPLNPVGIYEKTKTESDQIVINTAKDNAFTYSILRPSNVFGLTMTNQSLFKMIEIINKGFFFFIGAPGSSANYIHVDNVVEALWLCGTVPAARGRIYNLSDHRTIEGLASVIAGALERPIPRLRVPARVAELAARTCRGISWIPLTESRVAALTGRALYSPERIEQDLGYVHPVTMEEGMREMVSGWKDAMRGGAPDEERTRP